jgi:hypothetical protein
VRQTVRCESLALRKMRPSNSSSDGIQGDID